MRCLQKWKKYQTFKLSTHKNQEAFPTNTILKELTSPRCSQYYFPHFEEISVSKLIKSSHDTMFLLIYARFPNTLQSVHISSFRYTSAIFVVIFLLVDKRYIRLLARVSNEWYIRKRGLWFPQFQLSLAVQQTGRAALDHEICRHENTGWWSGNDVTMSFLPRSLALNLLPLCERY